MSEQVLAASGAWVREERIKIGVVAGLIGLLHLAGISLYLVASTSPGGASGVAGAGVLAYVLGVRHAFDADHIAAIDDSTRLLVVRGRRPIGVGFFFALGHSTVVVGLAVTVAWAAASVGQPVVEHWSIVGGRVAAVAATTFLILVAVLNAVVLTAVVKAARSHRSGDSHDVKAVLAGRGLLWRLFRRRTAFVRSSWHMYPIGLLMGLGLETASEVTLLILTATAAATGGLTIAGTLCLPLLFAAGMSTFDTADSLMMSRLYSWSYRDTARTLRFNIVTTAMTVLVALFVASVYLADVAVQLDWWAWLAPYAGLADQFQTLGYVVVGLFAAGWGLALLSSRRLSRKVTVQ